MLLLLTLACIGSDPSVEATATLPVPPIEEEILKPQVTIEQTRIAYAAYIASLETIHGQAVRQGRKESARKIAALTTIFKERFSPAELSEPCTHGEMSELQHDQCEARWAFVLFNPKMSELSNVFGMWSPSDITMYFDNSFTPSPFATSQLCHELWHVQEDIEVEEGRMAQQQPVGRRERESDEMAYEVLDVATNGRYGTIISAMAASLELPQNSRLHIGTIPREFYALFTTHGARPRNAVNQQVTIDVNMAVINRMTKGAEREARLDNTRAALTASMNDPLSVFIISSTSDN